MAELLLPNIAGNFQQGQAFGTEQRQVREGEQRRNTLNTLAQQAYSAPQDQQQGILAQAVGVDADAGMALDKGLQASKGARVKQLAQRAKLFVGMMEAGNEQAAVSAYPQLAQEARQLGLGDVDLVYNPQMLGALKQFATLAEDRDPALAPRVVGNALVDATGKVLYESPAEQEYQWSDARGVWVPKPGAGGVAPSQGAPTASEPRSAPNSGPGSLDFSADLQQFASLGVPISSTRRTPERNGKVGGVANSYHLTGEAADIVPRSPQEKQQSRAYWEGRGYQVIDEGDHLHIEPPRRGMTSSQAGGPPAAGLAAIPVEGVGPKQADNVPSGYRLRGDGVTLEPIPGGPADKQNNPVAADLAKGEMGMRKELTDRIKPDRQTIGMYTNVQQAAQNPSAAGDLSLIFAYMKMLDPGSVVREQEFANAQNAAGVPDQIRNAFNKVKSGERLNPTQRQDFLQQAANLATAAQARITAGTREYQGIADQYGWDPTRSTGMADFRDVAGAVQGQQPSAPSSSGFQVGQVIEANGKRYRVVGGDPADPDVEEIQ